MKNILLINHYAGSPEMGMEFRPYYFAREWVRAGHQVHIIAGDYSHLRRKNPDVTRDWQIEKIDGIYYHWVKTGEYEGNGVARALTMERFVRKIMSNADELVKLVDPDVIICSSTYPLDTYAGQKLRKAANQRRGQKTGKGDPLNANAVGNEQRNASPVKLVHEVHDMWPATLIELGGMSKSNPFVVAMQIAEDSAYKNSDIIISMPKYTKEYMMEHGMSKDKWYHVPNGIDTSEWDNRAELSELHKSTLDKLKADGKFIVGYFGGHALSNALDTLIDAAGQIATENSGIHFVLVGDGVEKPALMAKAVEENIANVTFLPPIDKREIPSLCESFDCIYMGAHESSLYRFGMSLNKMTDSMMSGKPIVCAITSAPTWVEDARCGIVIPSGDVDGICDAIEKIANMTAVERSDIGEKGQIYAREHLDVSKNAMEMLDIMMGDVYNNRDDKNDVR